jgi:hypothetical protein
MSGRRSTPHTPRARALFRRLTQPTPPHGTPATSGRTPSRRINFEDTPPVSSIRRTPKPSSRRSSRKVVFSGYKVDSSPKSPEVSEIRKPVKSKFTKEEVINTVTKRTSKYTNKKNKLQEKYRKAATSKGTYEEFLEKVLENRLDPKYVYDYVKARKTVMKDHIATSAAGELRDFFSQNYENFDPIHLAARHSFRAAHGLSEYNDDYLNDLMTEAGYKKGEEGIFMTDIKKYYENYLGDIELLQMPWDDRKDRIKVIDEMYRLDDYITDATYDLPVEDVTTRNEILNYALENIEDYMASKYQEAKYKKKLEILESEVLPLYAKDFETLENVTKFGVDNKSAIVDIGQQAPYIGMQTSVGQIGSMWGADSQLIGPATQKFRVIKSGLASDIAEPMWMEQALSVKAPLYRLFVPGGFSA